MTMGEEIRAPAVETIVTREKRYGEEAKREEI
jgi:hypothetical protein